MRSNFHYLVRREKDEKSLRKKFLSEKILYGFNQKSKQLEAWYCTGKSMPYMIGSGKDYWDIVRQIAHRRKFDQMRAKDMLKSIDEHNKKIQDGIANEAHIEAASQLKHVASGRKLFLM